MTDDDLFAQLRAEVVTADVGDGAASEMQRRAHERLRNPQRALSATLRAAESLAVTAVAIAQIAWAWSVVLG